MGKLVMRNEIFLQIQIDLELRKKIADSDGINHMTVRKLCIEKSRRLSEINNLKIIKEHTGWTDADIFEETP